MQYMDNGPETYKILSPLIKLYPMKIIKRKIHKRKLKDKSMCIDMLSIHRYMIDTLNDS